MKPPDGPTARTSPGVVFPPPLIFATALIVGIVFDRFVTGWSTSFTGTAEYLLAALLAGAGIAMIAAALGLFRRAGTRPEPWQPSSALVIGGLYRYTRNPMYLGMAHLHAGLALSFASPTALVLLAPVIMIIQKAVIAREERYLVAQFGDAYLRYKAQVRPWL